MSKIKYADIDRYGSCWSICKKSPYDDEHFVMVGSDYCRKKCPHFKKAFKFLFWTVVVCDLKQTDRVTEPYWYEMLR